VSPKRSKRETNCPNREQHTDGRPSYPEWFDWADRMDSTHRQERCPGCGLYVIWVPLTPEEQSIP
jgi:hypothetical protein